MQLWSALFVSAVTFAAPCRFAPAQTADLSVELAAIRHVRLSLPVGAFALEPRIAASFDERDGMWREERPADRSAALSRESGGQLGRLDEIRRCPAASPASCHLERVSALVALSAPRIDGESATIDVRSWYNTSHPRQPVAARDVRLELRFESGRWRVVRERAMRMS